MSGTDDRDALAAQHVLGTLEGEEAREAQRLARTDPEFDQLVARWEHRLAPLAMLAIPIAPPPRLWARIAASTDTSPLAANPHPDPVPAQPGFWQRVGVWPGATAASLAAVAALVALLLLRGPEATELALLTPASPEANGAAVLAVRTGPDMIAVQAAPALRAIKGKDLELWALPPGEREPRPLGLLTSARQRIAAQLPDGTQLMVSLEPKGGSPSGQPTGPVLYSGRLGSI